MLLATTIVELWLQVFDYWLLTLGVLSCFGYKSSPRHLWTYRLGYQHPSDNQPFDWTTFVWEVLTVHGNELHLFYSNYLCRTSYLAAVGTIFNVFSFEAVLDRDSNLPDDEQMCYVLSYGRSYRFLIKKLLILPQVNTFF